MPGTESNATPPSPVSVFVIEDDPRVREALELLVDGTPGFTCTGSAGSAEAVLDEPPDPPDVLLLDIGLPGMSGLEAVVPLRETWPGAEILMLTVHDDEERVFDALCGGATGYLLKTLPPGAILDGIREASQGGAPMSPTVARMVVGAFRRPAAEPGLLTDREREVLDELIDGKSYKEIAARLEISVNTVAFHIKQVYGKLHVHSRAEAVAKVTRHRPRRTDHAR